MITTGAAVAVPFAWVARLRGIPVVYIESLARVHRPSLSCRLISPIADRVYVQWPELLAAMPRARYEGTVFSSR
jgi:UDP-N-acetylglucosamine:LPS N-acetylglucosamine transferase